MSTVRVVSLFSGIGASDMGMYAAAASLGIEVEVVLAVDSWDKATNVYNANLPHPVAIVGVAGRYPGAEDVPALWRLLREGRSAITEVPRDRWDVLQTWDPDGLDPVLAVGKWGGFLDGADCFDPLFFGIAPAEAALMDPQQRLLLECVAEAVASDCGSESGAFDPLVIPPAARLLVGVYVGIASSDYGSMLQQHTAAGAFHATSCAPSVACGRLSYTFDFTGPSISVGAFPPLARSCALYMYLYSLAH